jgi:hypothetical protein
MVRLPGQSAQADAILVKMTNDGALKSEAKAARSDSHC